jgi:RNA polymerase sigma factor (sigma-70 family)
VLREAATTVDEVGPDGPWLGEDPVARRTRSNDIDGTVDLTRQYLSELGDHPLLSAEEEIELAQAIEAGREAAARLETAGAELSASRARALRAEVAAADAARRRFIQSNLRLVVSIAKRYQGASMSLLDLIQEGNLGLMRAVEKFDWRKGFKFSTYATWWIRQSIGRGIADKGRTIRLPSHLVDTMGVVARTSAQLLKVLGREPTSAELAEETGLPLDRVESALAAGPDLVSLSAAIGDDVGELGDLLPDEQAVVPFEAAALALASDDLRTLLGFLNDREREILALRFGLGSDRPLTLDEVGQRYNVTRERIRQIEAKALTKLRHPCSARHRRLVSALGG